MPSKAYYQRVMPGVELAELPKEISLEKQKAIIAYLTRGHPLRDSVIGAGINYQTWRHWMDLYYGARENRKEPHPSALYLREFLEAVDRAISISKIDSLDKLRSNDSNVDWKKEAWFLERRFPRQWARKDRAPDPLPAPPTELENMTEEQLNEYELKVDARKGKHCRRT